MRPGTNVTMTVTIPDPRRLRYETLERNRGTALSTYQKRGTVRWIDWKTKQATVRWADGTTSKTNLDRLKEVGAC